jgi:xanthine dehydrogenase YagT iron-sulfur-binding subunit
MNEARSAGRPPARALEVGAEAPEVILEDAEGRALSLHALRGRTAVVAFAPRWSAERAPAADLDDAIRAELRGLGAALVVFSEDGVRLFGADDPPRRLRARDVESVRRAFGVAPGAVAAIVIDERGVVRFSGEGAAEAGAEDHARAVRSALRAAGEALRARPKDAPIPLGRREMVVGTLAAALAALWLDGCARIQRAPVEPVAPKPVTHGAGVTLDVNGVEHKLTMEPRVTLLDALRENLGLTGTKKGCAHGQCGACTVLADGRRILACMTLAAAAEGLRITTIEGLAAGEQLHPLQTAFIEHDAFQCGYCTPGQIMSAAGMLVEGRARTPAEIREQMSGNLCRCGAYDEIVAAIADVQKRKG